MRRGKRLVQVQVHHIHAEVARARHARQRVHVGAIHIQQRALRMQDFGDLRNLLLENTQRRRIRQHQRGNIGRHLLA